MYLDIVIFHFRIAKLLKEGSLKVMLLYKVYVRTKSNIRRNRV